MILPLLGGLAGAGASLFGALSQRGAQRDANNINWQNLFETRRRNKAQEAMAKASRRDAYGNVMKFTPGVGWEIDTTPMTGAILDAQQQEELESLRRDAPRDRAAAERMDRRSKMGSEEFEKQFNEFRFRPRKSEAAEVADATQMLLNARRKGLDESSAVLGRQLMRTGGSSELASVYKSANDQYAQSLVDAMLQGKQLGRQNFAQREQSDLAGRGGELQLLKGIADTTSKSRLAQPGYSQDLSSRSDQAMRELMAAMSSGTNDINQASAQLAQGVGRSGLDLSGFASALGGLGGYGDDKNAVPYNEYTQTDPWAGLRFVT